MSDPLSDDMMKATRLTQSGRLREATALLQNLLRRNRTQQADARPPSNEISLPRLHGGVIGISVDAGPLPGLSTAQPATMFANAFAGGLVKRVPAPADIVPPAARFETQSFRNDAGSRAYKLFIPSGRDHAPCPLIVMLHGCSQSADDFAAGTRMNFVAGEQSCFVAYPEQTSAANVSKCWNWFNTSDQIRGQGEPAIIAGMTREIIANYNIDPSRVYVAGLSAGGAAAANLAECYPDLYAAVGIHSGLACGAASDMSSAFVAMQGRRAVANNNRSRDDGFTAVPTIVFHGDADSTVHPSNGAEVIARAKGGRDFQIAVEKGSTAGRAYTRFVQRDAAGRGLIEEWQIHGAGHAWSGGSPSGSFTDAKGPDASKEMLRFFLEHRHG